MDDVRFVAASPLLLSSSLLLLGVSLLAPVFLLLSGWGRRKPIRPATSTGVLLVEAADRLRVRLRILLEREGYHVLEAADETEGFEAVHRSPHPLVVVLDVAHVHLLQRVVQDRRMCEHHAYVVLCTWRRPMSVWPTACGRSSRCSSCAAPVAGAHCAVPSDGPRARSRPIRSTLLPTLRTRSDTEKTGAAVALKHVMQATGQTRAHARAAINNGDYYYSHGCLWGFAGGASCECTRSAGSIARSQKHISGPLLERIDIPVEMRSRYLWAREARGRARDGSVAVSGWSAEGVRKWRSDGPRIGRFRPNA